MFVLHIEHPVPDFDGWKRAFDGDPVGRKKMGVRRYWVARSVDDPGYVTIDLEFASRAEAEALLAAMRQVWQGAGAAVMRSPQAGIVEVVDSREL